MLISISVQNFLVFGRRVEMSLAAERSIKKFYSNVSRAGGTDVLKSACVYVGNNVGKTCMLKAIATVKAELSDIDCELPVNIFTDDPVCTLSVRFTSGDDVYGYTFSYDCSLQDGRARGFVYERLSRYVPDEEVIFVRDSVNGEYFFRGDQSLASLLSFVSDSNILIFTVNAAKYPAVAECKDILTSFADSVEVVDMNNIPMDKVMLRKWLKCGFVFNKELFPTEEGTPQGGIISPTLANMTLDGLQTMLAEKYHKKFVNRKTTYYPKVHLVRYADDFIITGRSKEALEEIKPLVVDFLKERGLTLSEEKTKITHIDDGFDFLGYNIRKYKGVLLIKPSKKSLKKFMQKIRGIIDSNKGSKQESLIRLLNPVITGWVNYYKNCVASDTFRKADYLIFEKLWQWAKRRHPKKGKYWIADRYFTRVKNRNWCFVANFKKGKTDDRIALKRLYDTKITRYVKIKGEANPFDPEWTEYFEKRKTYKMLQSLNGRKSLLYMWERQNHLCPVCGKPIDKEHPWGTSQQIVNGKKVNFLLHDSCRRKVIQTNKM